MSNLQRYYTNFLSLLHDIEPNDSFLNQVREPKLSDKELIALSLAAEATGIDSELYLFTQLPDEARLAVGEANQRVERLIVCRLVQPVFIRSMKEGKQDTLVKSLTNEPTLKKSFHKFFIRRSKNINKADILSAFC